MGPCTGSCLIFELLTICCYFVVLCIVNVYTVFHYLHVLAMLVLILEKRVITLLSINKINV